MFADFLKDIRCNHLYGVFNHFMDVIVVQMSGSVDSYIAYFKNWSGDLVEVVE